VGASARPHPYSLWFRSTATDMEHIIKDTSNMIYMMRIPWYYYGRLRRSNYRQFERNTVNQRTRRKSGLEHHTSCSLLFPYSRRYIFYPLSRYIKEETLLWAIPGRSARSTTICGIPPPPVLLWRREGGESPDLGLYIARSSRLSASGVVGAAMLAARVLAAAFFPLPVVVIGALL
jgi:hypothetical protein